MRIILIKDIKKLGKAGDILNVKDGYGNFLITNKQALLATNNSVNRLNKENQEKEQEELKLIQECEKVKEKIEKLEINFSVKTGEGDKVFGSISTKQIIQELKNSGYDIDKKQIKLDEPICTLGFHIINVELHRKVIAKLKIKLSK